MRQNFKATGTTVSTDLTLITTFSGILGGTTMNVEVSNAVGGATLNHFKMQLQDTPEGAWYDYLSDADFAAVSTKLLFVLTRPDTLAAVAVSHFHVKIDSAYAVRFLASVASSAAVLTINASQSNA